MNAYLPSGSIQRCRPHAEDRLDDRLPDGRVAALPELGQGHRGVGPVPLAQAAQDPDDLDPEPRVPGLDQGPDQVPDGRRVEPAQGVGRLRADRLIPTSLSPSAGTGGAIPVV